MRKKLTRANLDQVARKCKVMTLEEMDSLLGGNRNTELTFEQFMSITDFTKWDGAYVYGVKEIDGQLCFVGCTDAYYVSEDSTFVNGTDRPNIFMLGYDPTTVDPANPVKPYGSIWNPFAFSGQTISGAVFQDYADQLVQNYGGSNFDMSAMTFVYDEDYKGLAALSKDRKTIIIGSSFFDKEYTNADRYSMLAHECYHWDCDYNTKGDTGKVIPIGDFQFSEMPENVARYFNEHVTLLPGETLEGVLKEMYSEIYADPQRYKNEIEAYEFELQQDYGISSSYRQKQEANLWLYKEFVRFLEEPKTE